MDTQNLIQTILIYALPVLLAITLKEAAHGYAAHAFGDNTAAMMGRVTLNPFKHIHPIGTIALPLFLILVTKGAFVFGYAKPIPISLNNLRNPKRDMMWIALAGPGTNFVQAFGWAVLMLILNAIGIEERFFLEMTKAGTLVNLFMCAFNLFPIPPLDGGRVLIALLPQALADLFAKLEPWGFFIVMGLVVVGVVNTYWLRPLMSMGFYVIQMALSPLALLF